MMSYQLSAESKRLLDVCTRYDYFVAVGQPYLGRSPGVADWNEATKLLLGGRFEDFWVDAWNAIRTPVFLRDRPMLNRSNEMIDVADAILLPQVLPVMRERMAGSVTTRRLGHACNAVIGQLRQAVYEIEMQAYHDVTIFRDMARHLEAGHLVCGNEGRYPEYRPVIF